MTPILVAELAPGARLGDRPLRLQAAEGIPIVIGQMDLRAVGTADYQTLPTFRGEWYAQAQTREYATYAIAVGRFESPVGPTAFGPLKL